ncbi:polysaccharide biosynthesis tyrosine autokinase [Mucilaginibacter limnophilus]|uniref:Polysaccharide biosynthesis tyrosine autokinase n=1 Tax=Mucilaginibacter limnophilus TaxID=1932778 RepID=A0A437MSV6_9SPHI|nr:polysaccharide biosynthesis tyrosine autokinase [Mucilaginibacter limnophilus]RVU00719.1 polysaccharide biosynthesis tyrosine autokinase [Mucilaginibacter limnophilus]
MSQPNPFQLQPLEPVNIKDTLMQYWRNWGWFLLSLVLCLTTAFIYLRYATTEYMVESAMVITDDNNGADLLQTGNVFSDLELFNTSKNIDDEIEILKGKTLMQHVIRKLNLQVTYQKKGKIRDSEVYGPTSPVKVSIIRFDSLEAGKKVTIKPLSAKEYTLSDGPHKAVYQFGQQVVLPWGTFFITSTQQLALSLNTDINIEFNSVKKTAAAYLGDLTITPVNKKGNVLKLSIVSNIPQKGIDVLNELIELYSLEAIENKNEIASKTISFIDDRLVYLVKELSGVEKDVENYKRQNDITDISSESQQYLQNTGDYDKKLSEYEIQINILSAIKQYISSAKNQDNLVPSSLSIQDVTLAQLISNFNQLQLQRKRALKSNFESNPVVINLTEQLVALRQNILENITNIQQGLTIARNALRSKNTKFESLKQHVPQVERQLLEIKRQQNIKESLYQYLLQKREEASLAKAAAVSNLNIIDKADVNDTPVKPRKPLLLMLACVVAFIIPVIVISLKKILKNKISTIDDVKHVGAPVLGEIVHTTLKETLVVKEGSRTVLAELFRLLRSKLQLSAAADKNKVFLVTSTMSGEGKTFFCVNMGATMALAGKKVIMLEFDLRKPMLLSGLTLSANTGITNYLVSGVTNIDELIMKVPGFDSLFVMGAGATPPNPSELILSEKNQELFGLLRERFDYIIIDSPPVGLIADAFNLSEFSDRTLYLIRYNYTFKKQTGLIKEIYEKNTLKNLMLVLNDGHQENINQYGYGYNYGYSYGYVSDEPERSWLKRLFKKNI